MTRTKICGITRAADRDAAVAAGADALGFIVDVTVDTPRELDAETASDLIAGAPPLVTTVLVTMPDAPADAAALAARTGADAIQVHGDLAPAAVAEVRDRSGRPTIVAVDADAPDRAGGIAAVADALLLDTPDEAGAGGTGRTHDWSAARAIVERVDTPVLLAGGLTPGNVADAVATVSPFGVDVASGVEARGGEKDHDAVRAFIERATGAREAVSG